MKKLLLLLAACYCFNAGAQELFVFTEPASNMAARSMGIRLSHAIMKDKITNATDYYFSPELMAGISKKIMVHAQVFMSNRKNHFSANGGGIYLKYRFYSNDDVHKHFRMAAFGRYSFSDLIINQPAIDLTGRNSGYETGLIATQLINKIALSTAVSGMYAANNGKQKFLYGDDNRYAINYTFSAGKLLLPKEYVSYHQTNVNLMAEFLGQLNVGNGKNFLDIAPSLQFIISSRLRVDAGYRFALVKNLYRGTPQSAVLKLEYNFYNLMR